MSFAYIDSQGKEVPIPGPDALRLRIELGAITDDTQFYDSAADRWAAASEHEIYRQLKRDLDDDAGGFVAPPPSTIDPVAEPPAEPAPEPTVEPPTDVPVESTSEEAPASDFDFGEDDLTLAEPEEPVPPPAPAPETPEVELSGGDILDFGAEEFTLADDIDEGAAAPPAEEPPATGAGQWNVAADLAESAPLPGDAEPDLAAPSESESAAPKEPDFGMAFEGVDVTDRSGEPFDPGSAAGADVVDDGLEVESSDMSDFDPDAPPAWMDDGGTTSYTPDLTEAPAESFDASDAETSASNAGVEDDVFDTNPEGWRDPYERNIRERTGPRSAPPQRQVTPKGSGAAKIAGILLAAVVVGAGAWVALGGRGGGDTAADAAVELPDLPADLQPRLRQLAQRASQRLVEEFDSLPQRVALADAPGGEWLSGNYLGNASSFGGIRAYWVEFGVLLDEMIASEDPIWRAAFRDEVVAANMAPENAELVRERGLAGWEAASPDRDIVYDQLRRVIIASVDLHDFLVEHEAEVTYNRAIGGGSGDPVLEAVPATPELGEEMWSQVGDITSALDALGYLQQVETEPLFGIVKEKLVATGIR